MKLFAKDHLFGKKTTSNS